MSILGDLERIYDNVGDFRIPYEILKAHFPNMTTKSAKVLNDETDLFINYRNIDIPKTPLVRLVPQLIVLGEKKKLSPQDVIGLYPVNYFGNFNPESSRTLFIPDQKKSNEVAKRVYKTIKNKLKDYVILRTYPDKFQFRFMMNERYSFNAIDKLNLTSEFIQEYSDGLFKIEGRVELITQTFLAFEISSELVRYKISWEGELPFSKRNQN